MATRNVFSMPIVPLTVSQVLGNPAKGEQVVGAQQVFALQNRLLTEHTTLPQARPELVQQLVTVVHQLQFVIQSSQHELLVPFQTELKELVVSVTVAQEHLGEVQIAVLTHDCL